MNSPPAGTCRERLSTPWPRRTVTGPSRCRITRCVPAAAKDSRYGRSRCTDKYWLSQPRPALVRSGLIHGCRRMPLVSRSPSSLVTRAVLMLLLRCTLTATSFVEPSRARGGEALLHPTRGAFGPAVSITGIRHPEKTIPALSYGPATFRSCPRSRWAIAHVAVSKSPLGHSSVGECPHSPFAGAEESDWIDEGHLLVAAPLRHRRSGPTRVPGDRPTCQRAGAEAVDRRGMSVGWATLTRSCSPRGPEMSSSRAAAAIWSNGTRTDVSGVGRWLTMGTSL